MDKIETMKLELRHLAPYLPYGLQINQHREDININWQSELVSLSADQLKVMSRKFPYIENLAYYEAKPILHPLSDLTKEIEVNGEKETYIRHLAEIYFKAQLNANYEHAVNVREVKLMAEKYAELLPFNLIDKLFEWHFDVFGLIEKGLAIDINTLES